MRKFLILFVSPFVATYLMAAVVTEAVHDFNHPPGPCSVLDMRRCAR